MQVMIDALAVSVQNCREVYYNDQPHTAHHQWTAQEYSGLNHLACNNNNDNNNSEVLLGAIIPGSDAPQHSLT